MNLMHQESNLYQLSFTDWNPHTTHAPNNPSYKPNTAYQLNNLYNKKTQNYSYDERSLNSHSYAQHTPLQKQQQDMFAVFNRNNIQQEQSFSTTNLLFRQQKQQQQQQETSFSIDESMDCPIIDPNFCFQQDWLFLDNTTLMTLEQGLQEKGNTAAHASDSLFNDHQPSMIHDPLFYSGSSTSSSTKYCSSVNSNESNHDYEQADIDEKTKRILPYRNLDVDNDFTEEEGLYEDDDDNNKDDDDDSYDSDWYQSNITSKKKKQRVTGTKKSNNNKKYDNSTKHKKSSPSPSNYHENQGTRCSNCRTFNTPLWRRNPQGQPLCNACGLFFKLHGTVRPLSLKTDVIKKRNRLASSAKNIKRKKTNSSLHMTKNQNMPLDNASFSADENFIIDDHQYYDFFM